jgi:hypothetical protein
MERRDNINMEHRDNITSTLFCSTDLNAFLSRTPNFPPCLFLALSLAKLLFEILNPYILSYMPTSLIIYLTTPLLLPERNKG